MQPTVQVKALTAQAAFTAVEAAVKEAERLGVAVNAVIVDTAGRMVAFLRGDGAFLPSGQIAQDKAYTAAGFKLASGQLYDALKNESSVLLGITNQPGIAAFPGGLPIFDNGEIVGAIGVSGASAVQDDTCATAGIKAIGLSSD